MILVISQPSLFAPADSWLILFLIQDSSCYSKVIVPAFKVYNSIEDEQIYMLISRALIKSRYATSVFGNMLSDEVVDTAVSSCSTCRLMIVASRIQSWDDYLNHALEFV